jgi:hypothetical protein
MTENQLIEQLNKLSQIKPRQEWVVLAKQQILSSCAKASENKSRMASIMDFIPSFFFQKQFAYALSGILIVTLGVFGFIYSNMSSQMAEPEQVASVSSVYDFNLVNEKLKQLALVIKEGGPGGIAPAMDEFKTSMSDAVLSLKKDVAEKDLSSVELKDVALNLKQIELRRDILILSGLEIDESTKDQLESAEVMLVERMIEDLDKTTLTDEQQKVFGEIKGLYEEADYSGALEKILLLNK